jgi:hypothetical protein
MLWEMRNTAAKDFIAQLMKAALQQAYAINDEYLIANESWWYGERCITARLLNSQQCIV